MTNEMKKEIAAHDVISFDIFDTVFHRRCGTPRNVFYILQSIISNHYAYEYPRMVSSFPHARREAEAACRREKKKAEGTQEVLLKEIYNTFSEVTGVPLSICNDIMWREVELEEKMLVVDRNTKEHYDYARFLHKPIIFVSDMYIDSEILIEWLNKRGFYGDVFVSGEWLKSKYDGSMWEMITSTYSNILHTGDNVHSDVEMAEEYQITAIPHFYTSFMVKDAYLFGDSPIINLIKGVIQSAHEQQTELSEHESLGITIFGPLITGFLIWLYKETKDIDHVIMFARDGKLLHKLFNKMRSTPAHYMDSSRIASLVPSLYNFELEKVKRALYGKSGKTVKELLILYGINDPREYLSEIQSVGYKNENSLVMRGDEKFAQLLTLLYDSLQLASKGMLEYAKAYFNILDDAEIVAFVDLGWSGSLQHSLSRVLNTNRTIDIKGLYFHLYNLPNFSRVSLHDTYHSFIRSLYGDSNYTRVLQSGGVEILENVLSELGGTVLRYTEFGSEREEEYKHPQEKEILEIQRGVEIFFENCLPLLEHSDWLLSLDWVEPFTRLVDFPTEKEAALLGDLSHGDGAGNLKGKMVKLAPELTNLTEAQYERALDAAYWKQAFKIRNAGRINGAERQRPSQ